jgi:3-hydroxymyristoyl/3-hydroxydecanoyl-(acyl carrier protein) dehydratase
LKNEFYTFLLLGKKKSMYFMSLPLFKMRTFVYAGTCESIKKDAGMFMELNI